MLDEVVGMLGRRVLCLRGNVLEMIISGILVLMIAWRWLVRLALAWGISLI